MKFLTISLISIFYLSFISYANQPNVILIMTDDQGYGDLGVTGNPVIETPNLDQMHDHSARFARFYVSPVCTPTRASLMTGRYNYRTKAVDTYKGRSMMDPDEITIAEVLKSSGYATGIFGKWHLGDCYPMRPNDQGFDHSVIHKGGGLGQPSDPLENKQRYTNPILFKNNEAFQSEGYCTDVFFDEAMSFIDQQVNQASPFFIYIAPNAPHGPFHDVPQDLLKKYLSNPKMGDLQPKNKKNQRVIDKLARVSAMIENIDINIGKLMKHLKTKSIIEDTIVIYMMDNGPNSGRYVGNMRGSKGSLYEGGIRSPLFIQWKNNILPGEVSSDICAHIDIMPTILDITNASYKRELRLDGISLYPKILREEGTLSPDRKIVLQAHRGDVPVKFLNFTLLQNNLKLIHNTGFSKQALPEDVKYELFDVIKDPFEKNDLSKDYPEKLNNMLKAYEHWFEDVSNTRKDNYAPPRIKIGTIHENSTTLTRQDLREKETKKDNEGKWLLESEESLTYKLDIINKTEVKNASVSISINHTSTTKSLNLLEGKTHYGTIPLPKGKIDLEVSIQDPESKNLPWQIILTKI